METSSDANQQLVLEQLQRTRLENEKLVFDLGKLRSKPAWYFFPIQFVPLVTATVAVIGFLIGVLQYSNEQQQNRRARETQSLREKEAAERELMKPWIESQRSIYLEALESAATATNSRDPRERIAAEDKFWRLYQGRMILVETMKVSTAMVVFGHCLDGTEKCSREAMNGRIRALASTMADSMALTANMSYEKFAENQFRYGPPP